MMNIVVRIQIFGKWKEDKLKDLTQKVNIGRRKYYNPIMNNEKKKKNRKIWIHENLTIPIKINTKTDKV